MHQTTMTRITICCFQKYCGRFCNHVELSRHTTSCHARCFTLGISSKIRMPLHHLNQLLTTQEDAPAASFLGDFCQPHCGLSSKSNRNDRVLGLSLAVHWSCWKSTNTTSHIARRRLRRIISGWLSSMMWQKAIKSLRLHRMASLRCMGSHRELGQQSKA